MNLCIGENTRIMRARAAGRLLVRGCCGFQSKMLEYEMREDGSIEQTSAIDPESENVFEI